jgi:hypothetical protein
VEILDQRGYFGAKNWVVFCGGGGEELGSFPIFYQRRVKFWREFLAVQDFFGT